MGKVDRLHNRVEPFAALFWALGNVRTNQHLNLPAGLASLHRRTQCMSLYNQSWLNSQQDALPPSLLFLSRYAI